MTHLDDLILVEQARDYAKEYRDYHGKPEQVKKRSSRNKARRKMVRDGRAKEGDGKEVDHKDGDPLNNSHSNLRVVSRKTNRVKKSVYEQATKLYPIARALIRRAQTDAPNYRPASGINRCANCGHFDGQQCNLFDFAADPDYICDSWEAQDPPVGELRAPIERAHSGAMVALFLPLNVSGKVAIPQGEQPLDLHITLAYLGKADQIQDRGRLQKAVELFAQSQPPIEGRINGVGRFVLEGEDTDAFWMCYDSPALPEFRQSLVGAIETYGGVKLDKVHGFIPHITLDYIPKDTELPIQTTNLAPIRFDNLTLALAGERFDYPLKGKAEMVERAGARHSSGDNRMLQDIHDLAVSLGAMCKAETVEESTGKPHSVPTFGKQQ